MQCLLSEINFDFGIEYCIFLEKKKEEISTMGSIANSTFFNNENSVTYRIHTENTITL